MPYQEREQVDHVFVDAENRVHVLLPVVRGERIALDNTCKTVKEMQQFFLGSEAIMSGNGGRVLTEAKPSCLASLKQYEIDLTADIESLQDNPSLELLKLLKEDRLVQIRAYIYVLEQMVIPELLHQIGEGQYPTFPDKVKTILNKKENALGMVLSPVVPDYALRIEEPVFSLSRRYQQPGLGPTLREKFDDKTFDFNYTPPKQVILKPQFGVL